MPATCPAGFDTGRLRDSVRSMYERVARAPGDGFHFHVGAAYAAERLDYDRSELAALPAICTARFAGVGNPHRVGPIRPGATVLDHACGAGVDLLIAARRVSPSGKAIGVDITPVMRECALAAAREAGLDSVVEVRAGDFEHLPVEDASVDYVISNGVLNLAPDKTRVLREVVRVLRPGGELYLADVIVERELTAPARSDPDLWAACVGGAVTETELAALATESGLKYGHIVERFDSFRGTSVERKFGRALRVYGATFHATK